MNGRGKAALAYNRDLWASGVFFADALTTTSSNNKTNLVAERFAVYADGWFCIRPNIGTRGLKLALPVKFRTLHPSSHDGGPAIWHQYQAFNGMTAIKKASTGRVREMLRILNYLAAGA